MRRRCQVTPKRSPWRKKKSAKNELSERADLYKSETGAVAGTEKAKEKKGRPIVENGNSVAKKKFMRDLRGRLNKRTNVRARPVDRKRSGKENLRNRPGNKDAKKTTHEKVRLFLNRYTACRFRHENQKSIARENPREIYKREAYRPLSSHERAKIETS